MADTACWHIRDELARARLVSPTREIMISDLDQAARPELRQWLYLEQGWWIVCILHTISVLQFKSKVLYVSWDELGVPVLWLDGFSLLFTIKKSLHSCLKNTTKYIPFLAFSTIWLTYASADRLWTLITSTELFHRRSLIYVCIAVDCQFSQDACKQGHHGISPVFS